MKTTTNYTIEIFTIPIFETATKQQKSLNQSTNCIAKRLQFKYSDKHIYEMPESKKKESMSKTTYFIAWLLVLAFIITVNFSLTHTHKLFSGGGGYKFNI